MTDQAAASAIFLVGDAHGGFGGRVKCFQWRVVWNDVVVAVVECYIANPELLCSATFSFAMSRVLPDPQEVVEGDG